MPRIRTVKPSFFRHADLFDAEKRTGLPLRLSFAGLWTAADREGRFHWRPRELKLDCLPFDEVDFGDVLDALASAGFIKKYAHNGQTYGSIPSWPKHQRINQREPASELPDPSTCTHVQAPDTHVQARVEGKGMEGKGMEVEYAHAHVRAVAAVSKPEPLIQNSVQFERRLRYCAFVGAKLEVPKGCHSQFIAKGATASDLDAWYRHLDAGLEANPELVPDWPKWLWPKFESWAKQHSRSTAMDSWVKALELKYPQNN